MIFLRRRKEPFRTADLASSIRGRLKRKSETTPSHHQAMRGLQMTKEVTKMHSSVFVWISKGRAENKMQISMILACDSQRRPHVVNSQTTPSWSPL